MLFLQPQRVESSEHLALEERDTVLLREWMFLKLLVNSWRQLEEVAEEDLGLAQVGLY